MKNMLDLIPIEKGSLRREKQIEVWKQKKEEFRDIEKEKEELELMTGKFDEEC